mgnify:CR=1 FL=1
MKAKKRRKALEGKRIYICHTYYHVYVTFLKELKRRREQGAAAGKADLVLSRMSNDFEELGSRVESTGLFGRVMEFDEKREDFFPELAEGPGRFFGEIILPYPLHQGVWAAAGAFCAGGF